MKRTQKHTYIIALSLSSVISLLVAYPSWPHGGGLDDNGCHNDNKAGEYHCHRGQHAGEAFASKEDMLKGVRGQPIDRADTPAASERKSSDELETAEEERPKTRTRRDVDSEQTEKPHKKNRKTDEASKQKAPDKSKAKQDQGVIDINAASLEELESLPGVGSATAKKIVDGRPYRTKVDLVKKKVVPQSAYDKMKDQIVARKKQ